MKKWILGLLLWGGISSAHAQVGPSAPQNCSGSISSGGTAQNVAGLPAQSPIFFTLVNPNTSEPLWFSVTGTASAGAGSIPLAAATATTYQGTSSYTSPITQALYPGQIISVYAATSAHFYTCWYWSAR
jgi:hypothetical protein